MPFVPLPYINTNCFFPVKENKSGYADTCHVAAGTHATTTAGCLDDFEVIADFLIQVASNILNEMENCNRSF